jgi:aspartate kinase
VPIHVRSSFSDAPGTWIVAEADARQLGVSVTGAALIKDEARVTVLGVPDRPGVVHELFRAIARASIVVDMIVQNVATDGTTEVSFTVASGDLPQTLLVAEEAARAIDAAGVDHDPHVAKVSIVGLGMRTHTGVARAMFQSLADAGINIQMITTSEIKVSVLVDRAAAIQALRVVHKAFALDELAGLLSRDFRPRRLASPAHGLVAGDEGDDITDPGMEDLVISGVELDTSQARVTLLDLPDRPGHAARVFREIAESGVFVDMIVQNAAQGGNTHLSFTVPREQADAAAAAARRAEPEGHVAVEPELAKLSVMGVGMRTHTGVATRMFGALAERGINISLISTSEVRVNVLTDRARAEPAIDCLRHTFRLPTAATAETR